MTKDRLQERRKELWAELERTRVKIAQLQGAISIIDEMLAEPEEQDEHSGVS